MKQVLFFLLTFTLYAQSPASNSTTSTEKEADAKSTELVKETKNEEAKITSKVATPAPVKKELPPLQKDGGFFVLNNLKWQADNITKKSYLVGKQECEKDGLRLPTRDELVDAYFSKHPEFRTPSGYYLSSNRRASDRSHIWYVNFDNGHHNSGSLTREYNVRCVKSEPKQQDTAPNKPEAPSDTKK